MSQSDASQVSGQRTVADDRQGVDDQAAKEKKQPTVSEPGGFKNDPDDPTNPNEAIERARRQVRP